jgi:lipopolysaccharide transport system ATP-binding protein
VAVLDDFFPNLLTAFRVAEYNWYLNRFPRLKVYSTNRDFEVVHKPYADLYPQYAERVLPYDESSLNSCAFVYMNFLNNAYSFLPALTSRGIPFLMTLYPGGGFGLGEPESDEKLDRVLGSALLRGIIATQSVTLKYLEARGCKVPVHDLYGGAVNPIYFDEIYNNGRASSDYEKIRICFVAERYMPQGANKGYPQFIKSAERLLDKYPTLKFSVVGSFDFEDFPLNDQLRDAISFKGLLISSELKQFFLTQDIIVSPNRPFLLSPGNFDGFPTGCCVEASLCGVVVVCSDELKLNRYYTDMQDMVICPPTPEAVFDAVNKLIINPGLRLSIGRRGQDLTRKIFDPKKQLGQRSDLLEQYAIAQGVDINSKCIF